MSRLPAAALAGAAALFLALPAAAEDSASAGVDPALLGDPSWDETSPAPDYSVNIREEFSLSSGARQSIDSYLGEFENPYAPPESVYEGSRSEDRAKRAESLQ
jgi:hypothetical protein